MGELNRLVRVELEFEVDNWLWGGFLFWVRYWGLWQWNWGDLVLLRLVCWFIFVSRCYYLFKFLYNYYYLSRTFMSIISKLFFADSEVKRKALVVLGYNFSSSILKFNVLWKIKCIFFYFKFIQILSRLTILYFHIFC